MKNLYLVCLALVAGCTCYAVAAAPAFAADEWLANGAAIAVPLSTEMPIELMLINLEAAGGAILEEILCSIVFDGTVGPGAAGTTEDALTLTGEIIGELGMENQKALTCTVTKSALSLIACKLNNKVELWMNNLNLELVVNWKTQIELMGAEPLFLDHLFGEGAGKEVGYTLKCELNSGAIIEETCEGLRSAALENIGEGVRMAFNWENPIGTEAAECSLLGAATGALKGTGVVKLTGGETLTVS